VSLNKPHINNTPLLASAVDIRRVTAVYVFRDETVIARNDETQDIVSLKEHVYILFRYALHCAGAKKE
jgi:hypothetical protein